jgi:arginine decarboxylase
MSSTNDGLPPLMPAEQVDVKPGFFVPRMMFFTKGAGKDKERLSAFEHTLRDAGIERFNLVHVSSIFPPGCKRISREEGLRLIAPGQVVFCVMARSETNEPNRLLAASIGLAVPAESRKMYGYLSEHHSFGETETKAGDYAEDLAATMLASTLGVDFNPDTAWDEREKIYKMSGKIVRTTNITQSAIGDKNGLWTCVLAAAVFIL